VLADRFLDAAVAAIRSAERMPGIGSPRIGELAHVPGLRSVRVEGFPCSWFYLPRRRGLDVVRLLADAQDLEMILGGTLEE
jgi:toxin ParE1/3/4